MGTQINTTYFCIAVVAATLPAYKFPNLEKPKMVCTAAYHRYLTLLPVSLHSRPEDNSLTIMSHLRCTYGTCDVEVFSFILAYQLRHFFLEGIPFKVLDRSTANEVTWRS